MKRFEGLEPSFSNVEKLSKPKLDRTWMHKMSNKHPQIIDLFLLKGILIFWLRANDFFLG